MSYDGSIMINNSIKLFPGFSLSDFKKTSLFSNQDTSLFFWIRDKCIINGVKFIIGFWFDGDYLRQIQLFCDEDYINNEEQRKQIHDDLIKKITDKKDFEWGSIESTIDNRSIESVIVINYRK
jgi:hypothetical protein